MELNWCEVSNVIKEYRERKGLTQPELVREMKEDFPWVDTSLISKIEHGKCQPTDAMYEWACKRINALIERDLDGICTIYPSEEKTSETVDFTPLMRRVYEALQSTDIDHRLTRRDLSRLTGLTDRRSRDIIEELRSEGIRVGSELGGEGYWLCQTDEEYIRFSKQYASRAYKVLANKSAMDRHTEGQIRI